MIGLVTKLENMKNQLKLMVLKKLPTNLTFAQTFKVCFKQ